MLEGELEDVAVVDIADIRRWGNTFSPVSTQATESTTDLQKSPFPYNQDINQKIAFWVGEVSLLNAHAVVCCNTETLKDNDKSTRRLVRRAGQGLMRDLVDNVRSCKTGEAKITRAYRLPSRYIIHTVGPLYTTKFKTAAELSLFNNYRNVLTLLQENKLKSIGLRCIHSTRRGYPVVDGAHIALRTVRRYLERCAPEDFDLIIFVATTPEEKEVYRGLLPVYFPRSEMEERLALERLPADVGNEWGEPVYAERNIRISANPARGVTQQTCEEEEEEEESLRELFNSSCAIGEHAFSRMEADVDTRWRHLRQNNRYEDEEKQQQQQQQQQQQRVVVDRKTFYERLLGRARRECFSDLHRLRFLYQSGFDRLGRPVVMFIGRHYPAAKLSRERTILYFINQLDSVVNSKYVIVFVHTMTDGRNEVSGDCIRHLCQLTDDRYLKNLDAIYMLHAGMLTKMSYWWLTTVACRELKNKVEYLTGVEYLFARITVDQLDLPQFVIDYDDKINGIRYYKPEATVETEEDQAGL